MLKERTTHARNACPRCKSMQLDPIYELEIDGRYAWERFRCMNCGAEVAQRYVYEYTWAEWEEADEEE